MQMIKLAEVLDLNSLSLIHPFVSYSYFLFCKKGFLLLISGKTTYPYTRYSHTMAGVFRLIKGPQRQLVGRHGVVQRADPRALELQAAMDILAEVFSIRSSEVSEMIRLRSEEREIWPERFCIED